MTWKRVLREAGYDPSVVRDASGPLEVGVVEKRDLLGSQVGNPCECCGSRLIRRSLDAKLAWVGAKFAVVVYHEKKILRFRHNGGIPSTFDKGFFPLGEALRLHPPGSYEKLGQPHATGPVGRRKKPFANRFPSIVGQFRR